MPVAQRLWPETRKFRAAVNQPVTMRPRPSTVPIATRIAGVIRLFSKEYFTRNTIPRKRTNPPIQAKSFTPKNASQSNGFAGTGGGGGGTCGGAVRMGGGGGADAGGGGGAPGGPTEGGGAGGYFTSGGGVGTVTARGTGSRERTDSLGA